MKRIISLTSIICVTILIMLTPIDAYAKNLGNAKYTDIVTYINNYAIPSYNYNGYTFIVAEDLSYYGFDVIWNPDNKSLCIYRNGSNVIKGVKTYKDNPYFIGKNKLSFTTTTIKVYIGNYSYQIEGLGGIDGYTLINVDNLSAYGSVSFDSEHRCVKVQINDGLSNRYSAEEVAVRFDEDTAYEMVADWFVKKHGSFKSNNLYPYGEPSDEGVDKSISPSLKYYDFEFYYTYKSAYGPMPNASDYYVRVYENGYIEEGYNSYF